MYKVINNLIRSNIIFQYNKDIHTYLTRQKYNIFFSQHSSVTYGTKGLNHFLTTTFNQLPLDYRILPNFRCFKNCLKIRFWEDYLF